MSFTYDPSAVEEREFDLLKEGEYSFETVSCKEGLTHETKLPKVELIIDVFDEEGKKFRHFLHITHNNVYHLHRYWNSVGHPEMFEKMALSHDEHVFHGQCGRVKTKIEEKEYKGSMQKRSIVAYFIKKEDQVNKEPDIEIKEDDIQF